MIWNSPTMFLDIECLIYPLWFLNSSSVRRLPYLFRSANFSLIITSLPFFTSGISFFFFFKWWELHRCLFDWLILHFLLFVQAIFKIMSTPNVGLKLMTPRARVQQSTDWANQVPHGISITQILNCPYNFSFYLFFIVFISLPVWESLCQFL